VSIARKKATTRRSVADSRKREDDLEEPIRGKEKIMRITMGEERKRGGSWRQSQMRRLSLSTLQQIPLSSPRIRCGNSTNNYVMFA
jgi:hypothetical protein